MTGNSAAWDQAKRVLLENDASYFRRRAVEERCAALECEHSRARQAHLDMADRYEDLARSVALFEHHLGHSLETVA